MRFSEIVQYFQLTRVAINDICNIFVKISTGILVTHILLAVVKQVLPATGSVVLKDLPGWSFRTDSSIVIMRFLSIVQYLPLTRVPITDINLQ